MRQEIETKKLMKPSLWIYPCTFWLLLVFSFGEEPLYAYEKTLLPPASAYHAPEGQKDLTQIGITEKLGDRVDIGHIQLRDEAGKSVALASYFQKPKPVLLSLIYFGCPSLCGMVLNGLLESLKRLDWMPGKQFEVVVVSIDPKEGASLAQSKKNSYLQAYGRPNAEGGVHFLTGEAQHIQKLAKEVGFGFRWDEKEKQYLHGAAFMILTPEGNVSRYHYGFPVSPTDLKLSLLEASNGKIGTIIDRMVMFCYRYNPLTKRYSVAIARVVKGATVLVTLVMAFYLFLFWRKQWRQFEACKN